MSRTSAFSSSSASLEDKEQAGAAGARARRFPEPTERDGVSVVHSEQVAEFVRGIKERPRDGILLDVREPSELIEDGRYPKSAVVHIPMGDLRVAFNLSCPSSSTPSPFTH